MRRKYLPGAEKGGRSHLLKQIDAELIERDRVILAQDFRQFIEAAWPIVEPGTTFLPGYHIDAIAEHLQACSLREIRKLLINIPPRHTKSSLCSVLYPAWLWTHSPQETMLFASYSHSLALRDATKARYIIESEWFQDRWPLKFKEDANLKAAYQNVAMGTRQTTSVGGTVTGLGGRHLVLDDPHNVQDAESTTKRESAVTWFRESWHSRANTADTVMLTIMQRVHAADISHHCIDMGWETLLLPMQFDGRRTVTSLGWTDPREEFGSTLWPARYSEEEAEKMAVQMGAYAWAGQYQQTPTPRGGGDFQKKWLRFWYDPELGIPEQIKVQDDAGEWFSCPQTARPNIPNDLQIQSWDLAFKGTDKSDFVVGQVWAPRGADRFLLDQERGRWDFPATLTAIRRLNQRAPSNVKLVEEKANGSAVIVSLKSEIPGIIAVQPQGGKESRAAAVAPQFEAGNVYLPHPDQFPWVQPYIDEMAQFPRGANDDQVDATTQALIRLQQKPDVDVDMGIGPAPARGGMETGWGLAITESYFRGLP